MGINRLYLPTDVDGREIGSVVLLDKKGGGMPCVDVSDTNPNTWGIILGDMVRQAAVAFEMEGLTLEGRLLGRKEIERDIRQALGTELDSPTSKLEQKREPKNEN